MLITQFSACLTWLFNLCYQYMLSVRFFFYICKHCRHKSDNAEHCNWKCLYCMYSFAKFSIDKINQTPFNWKWNCLLFLTYMYVYNLHFSTITLEQIHFKFKGCQTCFICCKTYKNSCRLSKWWPWLDAELILWPLNGSTLFANVPKVPNFDISILNSSGVRLFFRTFTKIPVH